MIYRGREKPNLRVLDVLAGDDRETFDVLVVEPV